jgi:hypothetical protein
MYEQKKVLRLLSHLLSAAAASATIPRFVSLRLRAHAPDSKAADM